MSIINEFEKNYKAEDAIRWYTCESCFYRIVNKALRVKDYEILFALRFFITDIAKQIKIEHKKFIHTNVTRNTIHVYRGQAIRIDELELIKKNVDAFLSMNSFLSTSRNRSIAVQFARNSSIDDYHRRILFEIDIDINLQTKAFADISKISFCQMEYEILILLGELFRINKIFEDKQEQMWIVHLSLASDDDFYLKEIFANMKNKIGDDTDLDSLGKILIEMGEYEQAEKCYERMVEETQLALGNAHLGLGCAQLKRKKYQNSLTQFEKTLQIRKEVLGKDDEKVGESYSYIGSLHLAQNNHSQALINLTKAVQIQEKTLSSTSLARAQTYNWLANTYKGTGKNQLALQYYKKSLAIRMNNVPRDQLDIAEIYHNLGCLYNGQKDYDKALEYYEKSLTITRKILPSAHQNIVRTETVMAKMKTKLKK